MTFMVVAKLCDRFKIDIESTQIKILTPCANVGGTSA